MHYAISDLHGRYDLYREMLEIIRFGPEDTLFVLGDAADRNPGGVRLLKEIMERPNIRMLLGNHELMLLRAFPDPKGLSSNGRESNREQWFRNGGQITQEELEAEPKALQRRLLLFLHGLPLNLEAEAGGRRYLLCHASPVSMYGSYGLLYGSEREFAVWNRIESRMKVRFPADVLICGHTPTGFYQDARPMEVCRLRDNVIDIDCGCAAGEAYGGRLGCIRLEDQQVFYAGG